MYDKQLNILKKKVYIWLLSRLLRRGFFCVMMPNPRRDFRIWLFFSKGADYDHIVNAFCFVSLHFVIFTIGLFCRIGLFFMDLLKFNFSALCIVVHTNFLWCVFFSTWSCVSSNKKSKWMYSLTEMQERHNLCLVSFLANNTTLAIKHQY